MGKYHSLKSYSGEPIVTEAGLEDCERETAFYFSARTAREGYIRVSSNQASIVRGLLQHREYIPEEISATGSELAPQIVYTSGRLPMNCLRITPAKGSLSPGKIITRSARRGQADNSSESPSETPSHAAVGAETGAGQ